MSENNLDKGMPENELVEIRNRCKKAAPGPWLNICEEWNSAQELYYKRNKKHYHGALRGAKRRACKESYALIVQDDGRLDNIKDPPNWKGHPDWWDLNRIIARPVDDAFHSNRKSVTFNDMMCNDVPKHKNTLDFIAHAREDIPKLLDEIDRLRRNIKA